MVADKYWQTAKGGKRQPGAKQRSAKCWREKPSELRCQTIDQISTLPAEQLLRTCKCVTACAYTQSKRRRFRYNQTGGDGSCMLIKWQTNNKTWRSCRSCVFQSAAGALCCPQVPRNSLIGELTHDRFESAYICVWVYSFKLDTAHIFLVKATVISFRILKLNEIVS